jgi:hypothetical protein
MRDFIVSLLQESILINNFILITFFVLFGIIFGLSSMNPHSPVKWTDLLVDKKTNKLSLDRLGQFWGIVISSWVIIYLTQSKESSSILPMLFPMYLAFLGGVYSFNKYLSHKSDVDQSKDAPKEQ